MTEPPSRQPTLRPTHDHVAAAAQLACLLEASAPKPGNVSPGRPFRDATYDDFLAAASAIGPALARAADQPLGDTILAAVRATREWTRANVNLGIVLLLAPLARAALRDTPGSLHARTARVLAETTVHDATCAYEAIRLAAPGGLGHAATQDVSAPPSVSLREAMALAADRDAIAREYASGFATTFDVGAPALRRARYDGLSWNDAVVETALALLAHASDSLIARKLGGAAAVDVSRQAAQVLAEGGPRTARGRAVLERFDAGLRDPANARNPGTTADLCAAAIFVTLLDPA